MRPKIEVTIIELRMNSGLRATVVIDGFKAEFETDANPHSVTGLRFRKVFEELRTCG